MTKSASPSARSFHIRRLEHDGGKGDFVHISFKRTGSRTWGSCILSVSDASLTSRLRTAILDGGGSWPLIDDTGATVSDPMGHLPDEAGTLTVSPGWKAIGRRRWFCLPGQSLGHQATSTILDTASASICIAGATRGTLDSWQSEVAGKAERSPAMMVAICSAMVGPLLPFAGLTEGFIVNLAGNGSSGKTTANRAAASFWGNPSRVPNWNSTNRALEELAAANNHLVLVLDDAEQADKDPKRRIQVVQELTHLLAGGRGKRYSKVVGEQLPDVKFELVVLCSSPVSVEQDVRSRGAARTDGDRARLLEIAIPHGDHGGIWSSPVTALPTPGYKRLAQSMFAAEEDNFGEAGVAYAAFLVKEQERLEHQVTKYRKAFLAALPSTGSVQGRIAAKVGTIYAAGRIGIKADILPWSKEALLAACVWAFNNIIDTAHLQDFEPVTVVPTLLTLLSDSELFPLIGTKGERAGGTIGSTKKVGDLVYASLNPLKDHLYEALKLTELQVESLFDFLITAGALKKGENNGRTNTVRIGPRKQRMLVFTMGKLNDLLPVKGSPPIARR